jgi:hypothetical protein
MNQFSETQRFRQWWLWLVLILAAAIPGVGIILSDSQQERTSAIIDLIVGVGIPCLIFGCVLSMKLTTRVNSGGVSYQFFPIHLREMTILWDEIENAEIRKYKPIREYGGWGWRYSSRNGRAFNVAGDVGLQLILKDGKKVLIGTQKAEEMRQVLAGLGKLNA